MSVHDVHSLCEQQHIVQYWISGENVIDIYDGMYDEVAKAAIVSVRVIPLCAEWDPCQENDGARGYWAVVQSQLGMTGEEIWEHLEPCMGHSNG
jgi:hypothetical protein